MPAITVDNLSKAYRIGLKEEIPNTVFDAAKGWVRAPFKNLRNLRRLNTFGHDGDDTDDTFWALKDVSFEVEEGEVVGIIGRNGAGKSTLLKVLSRITEPTKGRAVIRGRVSSLLEVGTGFHPELSGRENIYMNGTILGMTKREIDRKFDEIVDFSGVEKFLDTPIKRYSSGMQVRLAFAVAAHLEPEILIIDEVLAVGDAEFQRKCLGKMQDVAAGGRTVLFVSHNMAAVESLCSRLILVHSGRTVFDGGVLDGLQEYVRTISGGAVTSYTRAPGSPRNSATIERAIVRSLRSESGDHIHTGDAVEIDIHYSCEWDHPSLAAVAAVYDCFGQKLIQFDTRVTKRLPDELPRTGILRCEVPKFSLPEGDYTVNLALECGGELCEHIPEALRLSVLAGDFFGTGKLLPYSKSRVLVDHAWTSVC